MSSSSSSPAAVIQAVLNFKEVLEKEIAKSNDCDTIDVERCQDILQELRRMTMTFHILNETLIGVTVNKLKSNAALQPNVKVLIKSWKQIAQNNNNKETTTAASGGKQKMKVTPSTAKSVTDTTMNGKTNSTATAAAAAAAPSKNHSIDDEEDDEATVTVNPATAFAHLHQTPRISFCQKLFAIFLKQETKLIHEEHYHPSTIPTLLYNQCIEMEQAVYQYVNKKKHSDHKKEYADKARSLLFNLNKNMALTASIILGQIPSTEVVQYTTEQLANEQTQKLRLVTAQKLIDSKRLDWNEANEDKINTMCGISGDLLNASLFTCGRCKSIKTTSTQKQTRSADEPMTVFVLCLNCGKRWKC